MKRPRFIQAIYAFTHGYFWLPCPICGRHFGGHEWGEALQTSFDGGVGVCPDCGPEARRCNEAIDYFRPAAIVEDNDGREKPHATP